MVVNLYHTHRDIQLPLTSRSRVLRPSSDKNKDEAYMIFISMHTGQILQFIQIFQKQKKTSVRQNIIHPEYNDSEDSGSIYVMKLCYLEK